MARIDALTKSGTTASARAQGKGPTLLVVHPGGADESSWDAVTRNLMPDFEVVRLRRRLYQPGADLTGHSVAVEVADILAIAAVLEPPIVLFGQGSGAVSAFEAALSIPWEFAGLIAYEPLMPTPAAPKLEAAKTPAELADVAAVEALGTDIERYAGLSLSVTLIQGELSPEGQRERVAALAVALPQAEVLTLPGQAHVPHLQAPDQLAELLGGVVTRLLR
jgi:pimeloyl-ACP methyl ester carboxylesterase